MLSYRHAYHAGNFADVMKHVVLTAILAYQTRKDGALCYIDTHAGAGGYDLQSDYARKTGESADGVLKLAARTDMPEPVADYVELVRRYNSAPALTAYPGSPWLAAALLRSHDRLELCELHSSDYPQLESMFAGDRRVHCHREDSYRYAAALVPPRERRGLIFMDPAFELAGEYDDAVATIGRLHRKFATGTYALWYPLLDTQRSDMLRRQFETSGVRDVLHLAIRIREPAAQRGMYGCGMVVINPPYTLSAAMQPAMTYLAAVLGADDSAAGVVEQWVAE